jgi:hypothetical protein
MPGIVTKPVCVVTTTPCPHTSPTYYTSAHNTAAWVGILLCMILLLLWWSAYAERIKKGLDDHYSRWEK